MTLVVENFTEVMDATGTQTASETLDQVMEQQTVFLDAVRELAVQ